MIMKYSDKKNLRSSSILSGLETGLTGSCVCTSGFLVVTVVVVSTVVVEVGYTFFRVVDCRGIN